MKVERIWLGLLVVLIGGLGMGLGRSATAARPTDPLPRLAPAGGPTLTPTPVATETPALSPSPLATDTPTLPSTPPATPTVTPTGTAVPTCGPDWRPVAAPDVGLLWSLDGVAPNDMWAVGAYGVLHWDGSAWTQVAVPSGSYNAVVALAANDVWLGGTSPSSLSLTVHWNGQSWTVVPSPNPPGSWPVKITTMTALSPTDIWAAGCACQQGITFALHWDGQNWTFYNLYGYRGDTIQDSAASTSTDVWVISDSWLSELVTVYHWDGSSWGADHPFVPTEHLNGLTVIAPNDAWLVGRYDHTSTPSPVYHWDGAAWTASVHPVVDPLIAVSARGSTDIWAVGEGDTLHWDGAAWARVPRAQAGTLRRVKIMGPDDVWAVGSDSNNASLIEHYSASLFADVPPTQPFYPYIQWLACRGIISGYADGTIRPGATVTRGQLLKMVVNAAGWPLVTPPTSSFADVDATNPFYAFIETGVSQGIISGYACGGPGEPCDPTSRPYFRPGADITRSQLSKVITLARGYPLPTPPTPTFADVPVGQPFYGFVEAMAAQGIVSGYTCGGPGEPCDPQQRPYFRPGASATRGQVAKFVTLAYGGP